MRLTVKRRNSEKIGESLKIEYFQRKLTAIQLFSKCFRIDKLLQTVLRNLLMIKQR
jgi:hypothetical protein